MTILQIQKNGAEVNESQFSKETIEHQLIVGLKTVFENNSDFFDSFNSQIIASIDNIRPMFCMVPMQNDQITNRVKELFTIHVNFQH